jgi:hypothetical protein
MLRVVHSAYSLGVLTVIIIVALGVAIGALLWWGTGLPPTRPRPDSRYRGRTYMSVHRRLERARRSAKDRDRTRDRSD